uniref:Uncharacterized protein n=1 Tax=Rhizophora mucronata TaxID=61149 RepID=A0A2P2ITE0_RHIMU
MIYAIYLEHEMIVLSKWRSERVVGKNKNHYARITKLTLKSDSKPWCKN